MTADSATQASQGRTARRRGGGVPRHAGRTERVSLGLVGLALVVGAWQIAVSAGMVSSLAVPGPWKVAGRIGDLLSTQAFYRELWDTVWTWAVALVAAAFVAIPCGLLIGSLPHLYPPFAGLIHVLRSIPSTALIPIAILYFGLGTEMKMAIVCYAIGWPLLLNTIYGVQAIDPMMRTSAKSLRWSRWRILTRVTMPGAAQYIGTALRLSGAIGLVVILSAELLGATHGIGTLIFQYGQAQLPAFVYAAIIVVGVFGMLIYEALTWLERRLSPWAPAHRTSSR